MLHQDYETRHFRELKDLGSWTYADKDLGVWCVCWFDDVSGRSGVWKPGDPVPEPYLDEFQTHVAWNANFERDIYERVLVPRYGFPSTVIEQWRDPSVVSRYKGYPGGLKAAAMMLGGGDGQKDEEGRTLMLKMAKPRKHEPGRDPIWWDEKENVYRLIEYCKQDVVAERVIHEKLGELPMREMELFWLDRKINERGVKIDKEAVDLLLDVIKNQERRANARLRQITNGQVERVTNVANTLAWLKEKGFELPDLSKATVEQALAEEKLSSLGMGNGLDLLDDVKEVLQIRQDNAKSSTAKIKAMKSAVAEDGRIHGMFQFFGAHTGRWTGRLVQLQNLPQGMNLSPEQIALLHVQLREQKPKEWLEGVEEQHGPVMPVISSMIRSLIVAESGYNLWVYDYKSIEPRVLSWLAGEESMLEGYRQGKDIYKTLAAQIYQKPEDQITKQERQFGKMGVLGCGYGMGPEKFFQSCVSMGLSTTPEEAATVVQVYRGYYSKIKEFWKASDQALRAAFENPGTKVFFGKNKRLVAFRKPDGDLQIVLPSKRSIFYPKPRYIIRDGWGESLAYSTTIGTKEFNKTLYGCLIVENIVQAVARDLMCHAMLNMDRAGFSITMTVHDEIVCEEPEGCFKNTKIFEEIMCAPPLWGKEIPIEVEGYTTHRYRK